MTHCNNPNTHKILRWFSNFLFNCSSSSRSSWSHPVLPATNQNEGETNLVDPSPEAGMTPQLTMSRFVLRAIALHYSIIYDLQSFSVTNHLGHDSDGLSNCAGIRYIVSLYALLKQLKRMSLHVCVILFWLIVASICHDSRKVEYCTVGQVLGN